MSISADVHKSYDESTRRDFNSKGEFICKFCRSALRKELEDLVLKGQLTKTHISQQLGMPMEAVIEHMENHMQKYELPAETRDEIKLNWASDKFDILINSMAVLTEKFNSLSARNEVTPADVKMLTSLAGEIRKTITDMSSLKGEVTKEHHYTINMFYNLQQVIIKDLCPHCRQKVLEILETQDGKMESHELLTR